MADVEAAVQRLINQVETLQNQRMTDVVTMADQRNQIIALQAAEQNNRNGINILNNAANAAGALAGAPAGAAVAAVAAGGGGRKVLPRLTFANGEKEDWLSFRTGFLNVVRFQRYEQAESKWAAKSCMQGAALLAITDINHEDDRETLEELLARYEAKFLPPAASALARTHFEAAKQGQKESILAFHGRISTLFARAYPGLNAGDLLIRAFTTGLKTLRLREFVQRASPATWDAALQAALAEQAIVESNRSLVPEDSMDINALDPRKIKCHFCLKMGHVQAECHQKLKEAREKKEEKGKKGVPSKKKMPFTPSDEKKKAIYKKLLQEIVAAGDEDEEEEEEPESEDDSDDDESDLIQELVFHNEEEEDHPSPGAALDF
jgi:hypothetical protein